MNFESLNELAKKWQLGYHTHASPTSCVKEAWGNFSIRQILESKEGLRIHYLDLCGPFKVTSIGGKSYFNLARRKIYFITSIDMYSKKT